MLLKHTNRTVTNGMSRNNNNNIKKQQKENESLKVKCVNIWTYMRGNQIGKDIEAKTPPNAAKDVASDLLEFVHHVNAVVKLWKELK